MEFIVPQFIEREPKIVGPFTFKQFIFIGIAGGLSIVFYFLVPFFLFLIIAIVLFSGAAALVFLKPGGIALPAVIKNFFIFLSRPKIYLWKRKTLPPKIFREPEKPKEEVKKESVLKIAKGSRLKELFTELETKTK